MDEKYQTQLYGKYTTKAKCPNCIGVSTSTYMAIYYSIYELRIKIYLCFKKIIQIMQN